MIIFWRVNSNLLQNPHSFGQYVSITDFAFLQKSDFAQDLHIPLFASRSLSLHSTMWSQKKMKVTPSHILQQNSIGKTTAERLALPSTFLWVSCPSKKQKRNLRT